MQIVVRRHDGCIIPYQIPVTPKGLQVGVNAEVELPRQAIDEIVLIVYAAEVDPLVGAEFTVTVEAAR